MASGDQANDKENGANHENETVTKIDWTPEEEIHLMSALLGRKPFGIDRHFLMLSVIDDFNKFSKKRVNPSILWEHLETWYDMEALNENNEPPSPIRAEKDFGELIRSSDELGPMIATRSTEEPAEDESNKTVVTTEAPKVETPTSSSTAQPKTAVKRRASAKSDLSKPSAPRKSKGR